MERRALVAFFVFLFVGLPGYSQPCLSIDHSSFDFGEVMDGAVVEHTFLLKNVGDMTLKIFRVAYNCSCTSYEIPKTEIAPGESVPLTVRFTTTGYSALPQPISQTVTIYSNDPANPHKIALQGRVLATQSAATIQSTADTPLLSGSDVPASRIPLKPILVNLQVDLVTPEDAEAVLPILDLIESYGWRTTVYVTGKIALAYPDLVKEIHDRGHQIGVLGWEAGEDLLSLSEDELYDRLENAFLAVRAAVGEMRPEYIADFKPQGYRVNETLLRALARLEVRSCTGLFPNGPDHPHHLQHYGFVGIPLAETSRGEGSQTVCLADGEYLRAGKSLQDFLTDLRNTYETYRAVSKPFAARIRPSLGWHDPGIFEAFREFMSYVGITAGKVAVVDLLTVQANPFIPWIKVTGPTSASPGEKIIITIQYEATCYCPAYLFHIYGRYPGEDWAFLGAQYYPSAYIRVGTHSFTSSVAIPGPAKDSSYILRVVGRACHGEGCVPAPEDYEAMAEYSINLQPATVEVQITRIVPVQVVERFPLVRDKATVVRVFVSLRGVEDGHLVKARFEVDFDGEKKTQDVWLSNWDGMTYCFSDYLAFTFVRLVDGAKSDPLQRAGLDIWLRNCLYSYGIDSVNLGPFFPKTTGKVLVRVTTLLSGGSSMQREEWYTVKEHPAERKMLFQRLAHSPLWLISFVLDRDNFARFAAQQIQFVLATYPIPESQLVTNVIWDEFITCPYCLLPSLEPTDKILVKDAPKLSAICQLGGYWRCAFVVPSAYAGDWGGLPLTSNIVVLNERTPKYTLAHEIGHTYGLDGLADTQTPSLAGDGWEVGHPTPCRVSREKTDKTSPFNFYDFMTYYAVIHERDVWISTSNYKKLMDKLLPSASDPRVLWVSGLIYEDDTVELFPFYILEGSVEDLGPGSYSFEAVDAHGAVLSVTTFEPTFIEGICPFSFAIPYFEGTRKIVLKHGATLLAEVPVTAHSPEITSLTVTPLGSSQCSVTWEAVDADNDDLYYTLFYSHNGSDWLPLASLTESSFEFDTSLLPGGISRIKLVVTDGVNSTEAISSPFFVTTKHPAVFILFPEDGSAFQFGSEVYFVGGAYDPEDGRLADVSLTWSSDVDGILGTGEVLDVPFLSPGTHRITLMATDSEGKSATATVQIDVEVPAPALIGRVTSYTGAPVEAALIEVRGPSHASAVTDTNGRYIVSNLNPGEYMVFVTPQSPNLMRCSSSFILEVDQVLSLDFALEAAGSIGGSVTDATGAPISGVWVRPGPIWQEPPHYQVVNGDYIIPSLSAGTYTVEIDAPGYGEWYIYVNGQYVTKGTSVTVEVELGKTTRVDFTQRSPGVGLIYDFEYTSQAEAEAAGWTFTGLWKLITEEQARRFSPKPTPFPSPTHAAYFGNENGNYVTLGTLGTEAPPDRPELRLMQAGSRRSYGELSSPAIPVSGVSSVELSFQYFRVVEYYPKGSYDKTYVQVSLDGGSWETIWSLDSTTPSEPGWKSAGPITISVPTGASTMRVRFAFDSVDHFYNNYLGWLVDNVRIVSAQPGVTRFTYSNLTVAPTAGPIPLRITAVATLTNIGTTRGTENVRFFVDGVERATRAVTLDPGSSTTVTFDYTFTDPGNYSVTIDNLPPVTIRAGMALFYEGFEAGALGWEFTNLWHISSDSGCFQCEKLSGAYAYYAQGCNYNTRARTKGTLTSPVVDLQGAQFVQIRFDHFRHVEQYAGGDFDRTTLEISFDGGPWTTVWMRSSRHPSPECGTVTIGPFAVPSGATAMRLRFVFDSVDQYYNDFRGWAVDNVTVAPASSGQPLATFAIEPSGPRSLAELISVFNVPNPVRDVHTTTFVVRGVEAEKIRVEVYDLAGRLVWQGEGLGNELTWGTQDLTGLPLANGVYLWRVWVKVGEEWVVSAIQKLVILR
jgi:peptidoglycan/xylan/chitin deacetylase (PgdA/CDA1 family)